MLEETLKFETKFINSQNPHRNKKHVSSNKSILRRENQERMEKVHIAQGKGRIKSI